MISVILTLLTLHRNPDYNTIYLGATSVSHIHNILPVSLSFRYRSLAQRDIPAMNSTKLHFLCE